MAASLLGRADASEPLQSGQEAIGGRAHLGVLLVIGIPLLAITQAVRSTFQGAFVLLLAVAVAMFAIWLPADERESGPR